MPANIRFTSRLGALPPLKLGDRVLVQPGNRQGIVIGVRYGEIAYDVRCASECLRNLCPKQIRRASLSVVEASLWHWILWGGMAPVPNGPVKVPA